MYLTTEEIVIVRDAICKFAQDENYAEDRIRFLREVERLDDIIIERMRKEISN